MSPIFAIFLSTATAVAHVGIASRLAYPHARTRLVIEPLLRRSTQMRWSIVQKAIMGYVAIAVAVVWAFVAIDASQPPVTRAVGALHTVVVIGWTAYLVIAVALAPRR
jgi:hypothetical protein